MVRKALYIGNFLLLLLAAGAVTGFAEPPQLVGLRFDAFCDRTFGARYESEMYRMFGSDLKRLDGGSWSYVSETSAVMAWETNLPAKSFVQYGLAPGAYIFMTPITGRNCFLHVHHLRNLSPTTTYYYRLVVLDEKVRIVRSEEKTFTTRKLINAIRIPENLMGPPYILDKPGTTYVVTKDIKAPSTAFNIAADGVTLDLGGRTVTYDDEAGSPDPGASLGLYGRPATQGPCGIRTADGKKGITIVNGTIQQGKGNGTSKPGGYYPIHMRHPRDTELAGVSVVYSGSQVSGIVVDEGQEGVSIHHNTVTDLGTELYNRHKGVDAIEFNISKTVTKTSKCDHNLILRTRHRGIAASENNEIFSNEIYIDSYATNSYGIMYDVLSGAKKLSIHHNRIFGTGFHPIGIGSGQGWSDVEVSANYVQMQGLREDWRWTGGEGGGDRDAADKTGIYPVNGIRLQKPRSNVRHYDNTVVVKGRGVGCVMRGLWLVPDSRIGPQVSFRNNHVKVIAEDPSAQGYAVAACGAGSQTASPCITLEENVIESNIANVQFGDHYGFGGPYLFVGNTLVKSGNDKRYRTVRVGWSGSQNDTYGHRFVDTKLEGGASFDSVSFDGAKGRKYDFSVAWKVDIRTAAGAKVSIKNSSGRQIHTGTADNQGKLSVELTEAICGDGGKRTLTPHTITVEKGGKSASRQVTLDKPQTVEIGV